MCKYGRTTRYTCSTVYGTGYCNDGYCGLYASAAMMVEPGDSGGPWFYGSGAKGITNGFATIGGSAQLLHTDWCGEPGQHRCLHRVSVTIKRILIAAVSASLCLVLSACSPRTEVLTGGGLAVGVFPAPTGGLTIDQPARAVDLGNGCVGAELPGYDESPMILAVPTGSTIDSHGQITVIAPKELGLDDLRFSVGDEFHMQAAGIYRLGEPIPEGVITPDGCPDLGIWLVLPT